MKSKKIAKKVSAKGAALMADYIKGKKPVGKKQSTPNKGTKFFDIDSEDREKV